MIARRAALASVATALFLGGLKAWAATRTGSVAVLASLADSVLDLVASLVTLGGVHWASQPADKEHRFGHGKAEALAALFQVAVICVSAFAILLRAIQRMFANVASTDAGYGIGVSVVAIVVTFALTRYQRRAIRESGSIAIGTDNIHYQSDLFLNGAVILALLLDQYAGLTGADAIFGIAIALWLLFGAWRGSVAAIDQLMDKEWPEDKRRAFIEVASSHPELKGLHDLRTRTSGSRDFVQFHVWVDADMTVARAHDVVDDVEAKLQRAFPDTEILIHIDPEGHVDMQPGALAAVDETAQFKEAE